jgi:hypothetical protein
MKHLIIFLFLFVATTATGQNKTNHNKPKPKRKAALKAVLIDLNNLKTLKQMPCGVYEVRCLVKS